MSLTNRVALITGSSRGIGRAIALVLAREGCKIAIHYHQNRVKADAVVNRIHNDLHGEAIAVGGDIANRRVVETIFRTVMTRFGMIDIVVNNAGIYPKIPLAEMTEKSFDDVISVNLKGTLLCSRATSQKMVEQGRGGCIINIASIEAIHSSGDGMTAYAASKGAVLSLTRSLAHELGKHDIRVNAIAPGSIRTEGIRSVFSGSAGRESKAQLKAFKSRMLLGRMGEADEIGRAALFLASDMASYVTGSMIVVDGGYLATYYTFEVEDLTLAFVGVLILVSLPFLLAHLLSIPTVLGDLFIIRPLRARQNSVAKKILAAHQGTKIAVAGSFGKTTMKEILEQFHEFLLIF